ncbi:Z1 domain-containing protein [Arthrobacter livingstonensis]|nr:Z1 domain-containing protein [Arthrobacter livingstonensis]
MPKLSTEPLTPEQIEHQKNVGEVADHIEGLVRGGMSIAAAAQSLSTGFFRVPPEMLAEGRHTYEKRCHLVEEWDDEEGGSTMSPFDMESWYGGPKESDVFWPPLYNRLSSEIADGVVDVDKSSSRVISLGDFPGKQLIDTRGLVLGYVQSGKTTNFMSVIAKAADLGYRMIIILSGTTDNLRRQTQERLDDYLAFPNRSKIHPLTTQKNDFCEVTTANALLNQDEMRLLAVVKKNPARLRRLNKWLKSASATTLAKCPILVIDDEADQASIDVGARRQSTINKLIRELLSHPKSAYIAYTATPFANLLIDPKDESDLYPRNFIVSLPRPDAYFGPERIFGSLEAEEGITPDDGLDIVRIVSTDDAAVVRPPTKKEDFISWTAEIPSSLRTSILWFLLATTARRIRSNEIRHSSMLVHTSMRALAHMETRDAIESELHQIRGAYAVGEPALLHELRTLWETETAKVDAGAFENMRIETDTVIDGLDGTLAKAKVVVDNYLSEERLSYPKNEPQTAIVVGGNTLSRGLTLEGLISSYFVRASSAYDTLLQMGRWFGYRKGYEDLVRIWMTAELRDWFFALSTVETEIREEIDVYAKERKTPAQLPVRIRTHPQMAITSAAKMRSAVKARVSYSGTKVQTILFHNEDQSWLAGNIVATERLVADAKRAGHNEHEFPNAQTRGFEGVDSDSILQFLHEYKVHKNARTIDPEPICKYIQGQNKKGYLTKWNVVFMERKNGDVSDLTLGMDEPLKLLQRSKLSPATPGTANLKAISSTWDRFADLDIDKKIVAESFGLPNESKVRDHHLRTARKMRGLDKVGLLVIYPINKDSRPNAKAPRVAEGLQVPLEASAARRNVERIALDAEEHLIGISLIFPEARDESDTVDYVTANVDTDYLEDVEDEIDAADDQDEKNALQEEAQAK